jgi:hypothetical protein
MHYTQPIMPEEREIRTGSYLFIGQWCFHYQKLHCYQDSLPICWCKHHRLEGSLCMMQRCCRRSALARMTKRNHVLFWIALWRLRVLVLVCRVVSLHAKSHVYSGRPGQQRTRPIAE